MPLLYCADDIEFVTCCNIKKRRCTKQLCLVQRLFCYQKLTDYQQLHHSQSFQSLYSYSLCSQSL